MKYLVVSDIHGSLTSALVIKKLYEEESCTGIICLGDILYHGPRNDLPENYNPKEVIKVLNELADKIIAVRGNCDAEVDQMVLKFKINADKFIDLGSKTYYLCHGHHLNFNLDDNYLPNNTIVLYGHYHIPSIKSFAGFTYVNVGSITLPKENSPKTYAILDENGITVKDLVGQILYKI